MSVTGALSAYYHSSDSSVYCTVVCAEIFLYSSAIFVGGGAKFGFYPLAEGTLATLLRLKQLIFERCACAIKLLNQPSLSRKDKEIEKVLFPKDSK